jgi:hypothetical protein
MQRHPTPACKVAHAGNAAVWLPQDDTVVRPRNRRVAAILDCQTSTSLKAQYQQRSCCSQRLLPEHNTTQMQQHCTNTTRASTNVFVWLLSAAQHHLPGLVAVQQAVQRGLIY